MSSGAEFRLAQRGQTESKNPATAYGEIERQGILTVNVRCREEFPETVLVALTEVGCFDSA
jgi:hypothetical protein